MSELIPDPELDELVRALNRAQGDAPADEDEGPAGSAGGRPPREASAPPAVPPDVVPLDRPDLALVEEGDDLDRLLVRMVRRKASDLHLIAGLPPVVRIDGRLVRLDAEALDGGAIERLLRRHLGDRGRQSLERRGAADLTLRLAHGGTARAGREGGEDGVAERRGWRFRVNVHRQRGDLAVAIRALPRAIPTLAGLDLPASLADLVKTRRGLVLICGPAGAGKSTTLAALVGELNRTQSLHVITIEDPIEYEHSSVSSVVEQIEIGRDARGFAEALRASLRQDPDVILVGEMRDLETVRSALTAAETGHLVLSTLHTSESAQAIHRMVDVFPGDQQAQIRHQLALSLHAIVTQQLVPRADRPGRVPAVEILLGTHPVRHLIRNDQVEKLANEITLGKRAGMVAMEESLARLVASGVIDHEEAKIRSPRPSELDSILGGSPY